MPDPILARLPGHRFEERQAGYGTFPCPGCREDQPHDVVLVHELSGLLARWMPRGSARIVEGHVECHECRRRFPQTTLDAIPFSERRRIVLPD